MSPLPGASQAHAAAIAEAKKDKTPRTLLVLPLRVDGVVPRRVRDRYQRSALEALASEHYKIELAKECEDIDCALAQSPKAQRPAVLRLVLSAKERNYTLSAELIDGRTRRLLTTSKESCELCGVGEVSELFVARASVIKDKVESAEAFGSTLVVNSEPPGAEIFVDGESMGHTPASLKLAPGRHQVELRKEGHSSSRKAVSIVNGVKETLDFELPKILLAPVRDPRLDAGPKDISSSGWGWLGIGVGSVGVATGTTLLLLHKRPFTFRCDPALQEKDANGNCRYLYDTKGGGIIALSVGGAFLAAGITLAILSKRRAKGKNRKKKVAFRPALDGLSLRF